jgi:hypothetical protein
MAAKRHALHDRGTLRGRKPFSALGKKFAGACEIRFVHQDLAPAAKLQRPLCGEIGLAVSAPDPLEAKQLAEDLGFALVRDDRQADDVPHIASFAERPI